ncbi:MAG: tetratricopeptide repeat protein [Bdellovibrionales bacterium]|nr:tetratricopeptide repeat protein [Bdellovibrionales bacterium]
MGKLLSYTLLSVITVVPSANAQHPVEVQQLVADGKSFEALVAYRKLPKRKVNAKTHAASAKAAWSLGLATEAASEFDQALAIQAGRGELTESEEARLLLSRGILEYQEERYQVATLYAEKMLGVLTENGPLRAQGAYLLAESLVALGRQAAAEPYYLEALEGASASDRPDIHFALGKCQTKLGKYTDARSNFEAVPLNNPKSPEAIRSLAEIGLTTKNYKSALFWLKTGREKFEEAFLDSWVDYAMVQAAIAQDDVESVRKISAQVEERYPPSDAWHILINAAVEQYEWEKRQGK